MALRQVFLLVAVWALFLTRGKRFRRSAAPRPARASPVAGVSLRAWNALRFYSINYDRVVSLDLARLPRTTIGGQPRTCRFCRRSSPAVRFSMEAHAVPELTGNKVLFTMEECNDCNAAASGWEDDFGKYTALERTMGQVRGKKAIPSLKSRSKLSRIDMGEHGLVIKQREDDQTVGIRVSADGFVSQVDLPSYRPLGVYKALVKMALTVVPNAHLGDFTDALAWLSQPDVTTGQPRLGLPPMALLSMTSGPLPFAAPHIEMYLRSSDATEVPFATFILSFGNLTFQIFVPSQQDRGLLGKDLTIVPMTTPYSMTPTWPYIPGPAGTIDLGNPDLVRGERRTVKMHADKVVERSLK